MTSVAEFYFCLIPLMSLAPPFKFYFLWMFRMTKLSSWDFSTTKYFRIIYFICSSLYRLQYFAMTVSASRSYCRYQSLSHSPPQQNFRQLFFSFRKVWGYPTSLIWGFINFKARKIFYLAVIQSAIIKIVLSRCSTNLIHVCKKLPLALDCKYFGYFTYLIYLSFQFLGVAFAGFFLCYFQKLQLLMIKIFWNNFWCIVLQFVWAQKVCLRFLNSYFKVDILIILFFVVLSRCVQLESFFSTKKNSGEICNILY